MQVSYSGLKNAPYPGFYKEPIKVDNISRSGFKGLMSGAFWMDSIKYSNLEVNQGVVIYPFHINFHFYEKDI